MLKSQNPTFEQIPEVLIVSFALDQSRKSAFDLNPLLSLVKDQEIHNYMMAHIVTISKLSKVNHCTTFCRTSKENVWVHFDEKPTLIYNECESFDNNPIQLVKNAISNKQLQPVMTVYIKESEIDGYLNPVDFSYPKPGSRPLILDESQGTSMTRLTFQNIIKSIIPETNELFLSVEGDLSVDGIYQRIKNVMNHDRKQFENILLS